MGTLDIIYLIIVGIFFVIGLIFALKTIISIRNDSIDDFKQKQQKNRNKIRNGRHN